MRVRFFSLTKCHLGLLLLLLLLFFFNWLFYLFTFQMLSPFLASPLQTPIPFPLTLILWGNSHTPPTTSQDQEPPFPLIRASFLKDSYPAGDVIKASKNACLAGMGQSIVPDGVTAHSCNQHLEGRGVQDHPDEVEVGNFLQWYRH